VIEWFNRRWRSARYALAQAEYPVYSHVNGSVLPPQLPRRRKSGKKQRRESAGALRTGARGAVGTAARRHTSPERAGYHPRAGSAGGVDSTGRGGGGAAISGAVAPAALADNAAAQYGAVRGAGRPRDAPPQFTHSRAASSQMPVKCEYLEDSRTTAITSASGTMAI
jgi:hypothetical protein